MILPGYFGTQGIFDPLNSPPGLYEACEWTDLNGNFWLYGGDGTLGRYSDLWQFNPLINQWAWIKGPGIINQPLFFLFNTFASSNKNQLK